MEEKESVFCQPVSGILRKELYTDFLNVELTFLESPNTDTPGGILDRDALFLKTQVEETDDEIEQTRCFSCRKQTPATVSACVHCGAHVEATYEREDNRQELLPPDMQSAGNDKGNSLIDKTDELF